MRQLDRTAPEILRVAAARHAAGVQQLEKAVREKEHISAATVDTIERSLGSLESHHEGRLAAGQQTLVEKLNAVTIDPAAVQAKAVESMLDGWERTLSKGGQHDAAPSRGAVDGGVDQKT
uniref:Uncharacterized protein n=1 Tax=Haptolina brevifila TaxID=156173 RepID=A0A7S2MP71_9EUKA